MAQNYKLNITGGVIEKCENAVGNDGTGNTITMSGGTIRDMVDNGIGLWDKSVNCKVDISGTAIIEKCGNGVKHRNSG
jgi:hypothetical protein